MPALRLHRQPEAAAWFRTRSGRAVLESGAPAIARALAERPGQPWLWLSPTPPGPRPGPSRGLHLATRGTGWGGMLRCALPLPFASESLGTVILQHVADDHPLRDELVAESARVLVPGGRLWLFALNPLAPYRWRWRGAGPAAAEPLAWRRRLRAAGLEPDVVSQGLGPHWRRMAAPDAHGGVGLRAAYVLCAEKRVAPLTPVRSPRVMRFPEGVPAA